MGFPIGTAPDRNSGSTSDRTYSANPGSRQVIVNRLIAAILAPAIIALGAIVAVATPASAATLTPPAGTSLISESFSGSTVSDSAWHPLNDGCLTRATVAPAATASALGVCALRVGSPAASASTGYLQLTDSTGSRKGGAVYTKPSASAFGLDVTFDQWQVGSATYGGDGLSFFIADGAAKITSTGAQGSSLGYAQNTNYPPAPNGIAGAYLGVGLDSHGSFASSNDGHGAGCAYQSWAQQNAVVLRGPGTGTTGYCYLAATGLPTATQALHQVVTDPATINRAMARKFRVTVSGDRFPQVTVYAAFPADSVLKQVLQYTMTTAAPATYQFGFAAASGSTVDTHLIGNVSASTVLPTDTTPPVVTIAGGASVAVSSATPKVSGTTDEIAGTAVSVVVGTQKFSTTVAAGGTWTVSPTTLANGTFPVSASVTDAAGNTGTATQALTIDTIAPVLTITGGANALVATSTPQLSGTSDAAQGSTVTLLVGSQKFSTTVSAGGAWSVTSASLADGATVVSASATDAAGNTGTATQALTVDTTAPLLTISGGASALASTSTPRLLGTSDAAVGSTVTVSVGAQKLSSVVSSSGTWSVVPAALAEGTVSVTVSAMDAAGNTGTATQALTIDTVAPQLTITGGANALVATSTPTVSGTSDEAAGTVVSVRVGSQKFTTKVLAGGTWSVSPVALDEGTVTVTSVVKDAAGNSATAVQELAVDTIAPVVVISGGASALASTSTPRLSGTSDAALGSTVTVLVGAQKFAAIVSFGGTWSVVPAALAEGTVSVTVSAMDAAGNTGTATQALTIDTIAPVLTITGGASATASSTTPVVSGTSDLSAGTTLKVTIADQAFSPTVQSDGGWSVAPTFLGNGDATVTVTAADSAGNTGTAVQTLTMPAVSIDGGATKLSALTRPTISGTAAVVAGGTVTVSIAGQKLTSVVSSSGTWSVQPTALAQGSQEVVAAVAALTGRATAATQSLTIDTVAPIVVFDGGATRLTNNVRPTISGTTDAPAGSFVTVAVGGQSLKVMVEAPGVWYVTTGELASAVYPIVVTAADLAGNVRTVRQTLTIDAIAPSIVIDSGSRASAWTGMTAISGRTDVRAGSTMVVEVDGVSHTVFVSATRTFSLIVTGLEVGPHTIVVSTTDLAGNVGIQRQRLTVVPLLEIDGGAARLTNIASPTISGTTDAPVGSRVTVAIGDQTLTTSVVAGGTWSVSAQTLAPTVYPVVVSVRDAIGDLRTARQSLTIDTIAPSIVITGGSRVSTVSAGSTVSGRTDAPVGSTIRVVVNGVTVTDIVSATRTFSVTLPKLAVGVYTVVVSAADAAGNVGTMQQRLTILG